MENKVENSVSIKELEKELATKEAIRIQVENAMQQILGQITCLKALIKKANGETLKPEEEAKK